MENPWWLILVLASSAITAITVFFDNYAVDVIFKKRSPIAQKIIYAFLHIIMILILLIFFPIDNIPVPTVILIILSGAAYSLALVPYYFALNKEDSTAIEIFSQAEPIFTLIGGILFLNETLSPTQLAAFFLIFAAAMVVILAKKKAKRKAGLIASLLTVVATILWTVADLTFTEAGGDNFGYATALLYVLIGRAIVDLVIVFIMKKERQYCFKLLKKRSFKAWGIIAMDYALEISGDLIYRFGLLLAPVALVSVVAASSELIFTFLFGLVLTLIMPKFGREKLTKRNIVANLTATIMLVIGIIMIQ